ncbi:unnamed protein product [Dicrocoelium dendriticum]|nr:unnamed protein product [Dicrocoelium dendriticum]
MSDDEMEIRVGYHNMPVEMQNEVICRAVIELEESKPLSQFPTKLKNWLDYKYGPTWHCVMGTNYCSHVSFIQGNFIQFALDGHEVIVFKTS